MPDVMRLEVEELNARAEAAEHSDKEQLVPALDLNIADPFECPRMMRAPVAHTDYPQPDCVDLISGYSPE